MRNRYLKARLSSLEYRRLAEMADRAGLTRSEYIRVLISREESASRIDDILLKIESRLSSEESSNFSSLEPVVVETLYLLRELTSERNAQVLSRVNYKLDQVFGQGRLRV